MTIDTNGLVSAQARVAQIQSLFGTTTASPTSTVAAPGAGTAFGDAMTRAGTQTGGSSTGGSPAAPAPRATSADAVSVTNAQTRAGLGSGTSATSARAASGSSLAAATSTAPSAESSSSSSSTTGLKDADAVLATAKKYLGIPYKWGGTNPRVGLDCSGFVQLVLKQHGISMPRVSRDQAREGTKVASLAQARPGDLVAFGSPVHHIGIYVGDGKMIHAPKTGDVVKISKVHKNLTAIRRVLPEQAAGVAATPAPQAASTSAKLAAPTATTPAAGIDAARLASSLRTAALSAAVADADATTWKNAVAAAVSQSLMGADVQNAQSTIQSAVAGLGSLDPATLTALSSTAAVPAAAPVASSTTSSTLAPDARGTTALTQAPERFRELFMAAERKYGVPATLLAAVAKQESNFKPNAVSHAGAQGLMQIMPGTARGLGVKNAFDPAQAVDGAARLLRSHLRSFGSTELALAAYNAGPGAVRKYDGIPPYRETQNYVRKIMAGLKGAA